MRYNPSEIEPKWQKKWEEQQAYLAADDSPKPKFYLSCMFPYPSGAGMHTGHAFEHAIVDAIARFHRAHGENVLNPMGWDAFGLPAENYAIKTGTAPAEVTKVNIVNFKNQLKRMGASIDWSREINTSDPEYYRWTQWVFTKFYERGLAYQKESLQWWCPVDKTVLAKKEFDLPVTFADGQQAQDVNTRIEDIEIPRADIPVSGANFEVLVGFDVTPQMADFNRQGKHFRYVSDAEKKDGADGQ